MDYKNASIGFVALDWPDPYGHLLRGILHKSPHIWRALRPLDQYSPIRSIRQSGRKIHLRCCDNKMVFSGLRLKRYDKRTMRQVVYVCKTCGHHNYVDIARCKRVKVRHGDELI
jgi:hypothetical protein